MLFYIILMLCISIFFLKESKKLNEKNSTFLKEYCKTEELASTASKLLQLIGLCSFISALLMFICFIMILFTGTFLRPLAALSIFFNSAGFIIGILKLYRLQKS